MTGDKGKRDAKKEHAKFPALREFFSGYLHQDFRDEYGSAAGAAEAFRKDASEAEIQAVRKEWKTWREELLKSSGDEIAAATRQLGAAWRPQNVADLDKVEKALAEVMD